MFSHFGTMADPSLEKGNSDLAIEKQKIKSKFEDLPKYVAIENSVKKG